VIYDLSASSLICHVLIENLIQLFVTQSGSVIRLFHKVLEAHLAAEGLFDEELIESGYSILPYHHHDHSPSSPLPYST